MHVQGKWPTVLVAGACVAGICAVAFFGWRWLQPDAPSGTVTSEKNLEVFDTPAEREREANAALPFRIAGVDDSVLVLEAVDICTPITADAAWSFGGDFSSIGSVPLSTDTVFGSTSRTPDDVQSYRAAIIGPDSAEATAPLSDDPYYEPRDGSGTPESLVWYSATLNEQNEMGVNNWQLSLWQNREGRARVLGSAEELNGTDQTPALPGEIVPKMNAEYVYYASPAFGRLAIFGSLPFPTRLRTRAAISVYGVGFLNSHSPGSTCCLRRWWDPLPKAPLCGELARKKGTRRCLRSLPMSHKHFCCWVRPPGIHDPLSRPMPLRCSRPFTTGWKR